jgi:hypothetical protein
MKAKRQIGGRYLARVRGAFRGGQARPRRAGKGTGSVKGEPDAIPKKCAPPKKQIAAKGSTLAVSPRKEAKATKKTVQPARAKDSATPAIRVYEIKKCFFIGD